MLLIPPTRHHKAFQLALPRCLRASIANHGQDRTVLRRSCKRPTVASAPCSAHCTQRLSSQAITLTRYSGWTSTSTTASTTSLRHVAPPSPSTSYATFPRSRIATSSKLPRLLPTVPSVAPMPCETTLPACTLLALGNPCRARTSSPPTGPSKLIISWRIHCSALEIM